MHGKLPRRYRLSDRKQIHRLSKSRDKKVDRVLFVRMLGNRLGHPRLAISVRRRDYPKAVQRNLIKRRIREHFRRNAQGLEAKDLLVSVRPMKDELDRASLERSMKKLLGPGR